MAAMWHDVSPALYKQIQLDNVVTLPSTRHIRRLTSALKTDLDLAESSVRYLGARKSKLSPKDLKVVILLDEVHSDSKVQYKNGNFYGLENGVVTKSLLCTMLKSVAGKYRDIISMSPISNISSEKVRTVWMNVAENLTKLGFDVAVSMNDGHPSNVRFFSLLLGKTIPRALQDSSHCGLFLPNPYQSEKKIFLAFDPTHLFKNFYGNFQMYKKFEFPTFKDSGVDKATCTRANFDDLQDLYDLEVSKPERHAHKLNQKILNPKSIEKTNAQLPVDVFMSRRLTRSATTLKKAIPIFQVQLIFFQIIHNWFTIFNVISLCSGQ